MSPTRQNKRGPEGSSEAAERGSASAVTETPYEALLDWACAAGLLTAEEIPQSGQAGCLLELLGRRLSLTSLGSLLRARIAEMVLAARSGTEIAALIRALDRIPDWLLSEQDLASRAGESEAAEQLNPWLPEGSLEDCVSATRALLSEIEAERQGDC